MQKKWKTPVKYDSDYDADYIIVLKTWEKIFYKSGWSKGLKINKDDIVSIKQIKKNEYVLLINRVCQLDCYFCRDGDESEISSDEEIMSVIERVPRVISFEWWEPTLSPERLLRFLMLAKEKNIKERILVTNGVLLFNMDLCKKLVEAGVTLYNINVHSHTAELYDDVCWWNQKLFEMRNQWIANLISLGQWEKIRFNFVINKKNYTHLLDYAVWVYKTFPQIFYIELNFVKVLWRVTKDQQGIMPSYPEIEPYIRKFLMFCQKTGIRVIVEGIPLCYLAWFEHLNIDIYKLLKWEFDFLWEKEKTPACISCSLTKICSGMRLNYCWIYNKNHIKPVIDGDIKNILLKTEIWTMRKK